MICKKNPKFLLYMFLRRLGHWWPKNSWTTNSPEMWLKLVYLILHRKKYIKKFFEPHFLKPCSLERVKYLHDRCRYLIYSHAISLFTFWNRMDKTLFNLYSRLKVGMLRIKNGMYLKIVSAIFLSRMGNHYKEMTFFYLLCKTYITIVKAYLYLVSNIWNSITTKLKQETFPKTFKESSKLLKPLYCP